VCRMGQQEAAVLCPHRFSYARVGSNTGVRSIRRREEEVVLIGKDRDQRVLHDIGIDGLVAAEGTAVEGDGRKGHTGVVFNGDIATKQGGHVPRGRRCSRERDVHIIGSYSTAEHRIHHYRIQEERGRQGSAVVSRGKVRSTPGTRAGDCILLEGRTGEAVSGGFGM
jgi:hypothetical protein